MAGFYLYAGNRQEKLIEQLAEVVSQPLARPLDKEYMMVQHAGIKRWVSMQLAQMNGVVANTEFLFPNQMLNLAYQNIIPEFDHLWEKEEIQWNIFKILQSLPDSEDFKAIQSYQKANSDLNTFRIAGMMADLYDQYQIYRPEMIMKWEEGEDNHWQAQIWRMLPEHIRQSGKPFILQTYQKQIENGRLNPNARLPERLTIFGVSYVPPYHLEVLKGLSQLIDVHFFFLNPCQHYWGDILTDKRIRNILFQRPGYTQDELYLETGNPLLSSWGQYGQDFFRLIYENQLTDQPETYIKTPLDKSSLLNRLQNDILDLEDPTQNMEEPTGKMLDDSLKIHSCHSRMREVEVLKDQLLKLLSDEKYNPSDILVMTPEIEEYAPLIQAVFTDDPAEEQFIPFSIADRVILKESAVIRFFLELLTFHKKRFTINDVFALFESEAIRDKFEITPHDQELVQSWIEQVNIRWGIDAKFRSNSGVPATPENTWQFGIDRILTGFAIPGDTQHLVEEHSDHSNILPFNDIEGSNAFIFGRFLDYFENLKNLIEPGDIQITENKSLKEWKVCLESILSRFFAPNSIWNDELQSIYNTLNKLDRFQTALDPDFKVDIDVITSYLEKEFSAVSQKKGFLGYGVTFCSMKPMRSVPFKVICMMGMNDKAFPRVDRQVSFDLSADLPKLGDRSAKMEDRYLFLETLISAREKLYISYIGQSIKDNSPLAPSTLVTELVRYLEQGYLPQTEIKQLLIKHPLQAFNPTYFNEKEPQLFSYSGENQQATIELSQAEKRKKLKQHLTLPEPDSSFYTLSIEDLVRFFENPTRFIYTKRLNVFFDNQSDIPEENEPFSLGHLEQYLIQDEILDGFIHQQDHQHTQKLIKAKGILPHDLPGELTYRNVFQTTDNFFHQIQEYLAEPLLKPYVYDLTIGKFRLSGEIRSARQNGLLNVRPSGVKTKDRLKSWLEHLVINLTRPEGYPLNSILIGFHKKESISEVYQTAPLSSPRSFLEPLLLLYEKGLQSPLPFFPRGAASFMSAYLKGKADDEEDVKLKKAATAAFKILDSGFQGPGEIENNPYFYHYFQGQNIIEETDFPRLTQKILQPVFEHQKPKGTE